MSRQFKRRAELSVEVENDTLTFTGSGGNDGLKIEFEVNQSKLGGIIPNSAKISVYNLSRETRERLKVHAGNVHLLVGYEGDDELTTLYRGQARHVRNQRDRTEWISLFHCFDAYRPLQEATYSKTFAAGAEVAVIIADIARSFGTGVEPLLQDIENLPRAIGPQAFSTASKLALDGMCKSHGLEWAVHNGRVEVSEKDKPIGNEITIISPDSGMLGSPTITDAGVEVRTLLNPRIRVNRQIRISSQAAFLNVADLVLRQTAEKLHDGDYVVAEVISVGDTRGVVWENRMKTYRYGVVPV